MCYVLKSAEIDARARKMCSLKFGSTENKKPKKMTTLEMYDGQCFGAGHFCWMQLRSSSASAPAPPFKSYAGAGAGAELQPAKVPSSETLLINTMK